MHRRRCQAPVRQGAMQRPPVVGEAPATAAAAAGDVVAGGRHGKGVMTVEVVVVVVLVPGFKIQTGILGTWRLFKARLSPGYTRTWPRLSDRTCTARLAR